MIVIILAVLIALIWTVFYYGSKIYHRRWLESFIDSAGVIPWPILVSLGFFFIAALAKIWSPEGETAKKWFNAGLAQGAVALLLAWFLRAVLWAAPDSLWPENANTGKPTDDKKIEEEKKP